eukprot:CAMPEP_0204608916 /NCGR_PEP_ID=MMETSP0661-20131031/60609_1 /ASSEMBLY_ACC=CAM_ASM_000606 /TAXON_ID=109239 /ORGANISM="Alexandrium margalefi, Strain AMGDE01CS-322" /LENGTH=44 /DNA_ID= /DNA_START= /DNA_END= /DNA_ORIENTATION=
MKVLTDWLHLQIINRNQDRIRIPETEFTDDNYAAHAWTGHHAFV